MLALSHDKNRCNDKWLSSLVDVMHEIEIERVDDVCRAVAVPAALLAQLQRRADRLPRFNAAA